MRSGIVILTALAIVGCGGERQTGRAGCGIAALVGPTALLEQFAVPRQTLSVPPPSLPERVVARIAAGQAFAAVVGRNATDSLVVVGVEGNPPSEFVLGYGVLVTAPAGDVRGVVLFEGAPVAGAPELGTITFGPASAPLIGVQADAGVYEDASCPFFPDSIIR